MDISIVTIISFGYHTGTIYNSSTKGLYDLKIEKDTNDKNSIYRYDLTLKQASEMYYKLLYTKID